MGVKGFKTFLEKIGCVNPIHLSSYKGKTIAVDFTNILYRYLCRESYIYEFINLICKFQYYHIKLIFVFDGKPDENKQYIIDGLLKKNFKNIISY